MPVYHFDVHDGVCLPEPTAHLLLDLATAKREAIGLSGHMIRELGDEFWKGNEWRLEVTDEHGLVLFALTFFATLAPALSKN